MKFLHVYSVNFEISFQIVKNNEAINKVVLPLPENCENDRKQREHKIFYKF